MIKATVCGLLLLIPWTRFLGAILHLSVTIRIVSFHAIMWRLGLPMALVMLTLNLVVLSEPPRWRALIGRTPKKRPRVGNNVQANYRSEAGHSR